MSTSNIKKKHIDSLSGDILEGRYANYFEVGYNAFEFIVHFGQYFAENQKAELYSRIITSPAYAKDFQKILAESIKQYEQSFQLIQGE